MTFAATILADSPALFWRCNDGSGATLIDSSGNGRHGTLTGSYALGAAGMLGDGALTLSGGYAYWQPPAGDTLQGSYTVMIALRGSNLGSSPKVVGTRDQSNGGEFSFEWMINQDGASAVIGDGSSWYTTSAGFSSSGIFPNAASDLVHYVVDATAKTWAWYANGVAVGGGSYSGANPPRLWDPTSHRLFLGWNGRSGETPFQGIIDEFAVFPVALSSTRVAAHNADFSGGPVVFSDDFGRADGPLTVPPYAAINADLGTHRPQVYSHTLTNGPSATMDDASTVLVDTGSTLKQGVAYDLANISRYYGTAYITIYLRRDSTKKIYSQWSCPSGGTWHGALYADDGSGASIITSNVDCGNVDPTHVSAWIDETGRIVSTFRSTLGTTPISASYSAGAFTGTLAGFQMGGSDTITHLRVMGAATAPSTTGARLAREAVKAGVVPTTIAGRMARETTKVGLALPPPSGRLAREVVKVAISGAGYQKSQRGWGTPINGS